MPPTGHHAPPPGAMVKVKPSGCCATLTPLVVVARLARRLRGKCRPCLTKGNRLPPRHLRRFSDCGLHDMTRDKVSVQCYPMRPAIRKETPRNERAPREYGPGLREETSGVRSVRIKNWKDRHTRHLKRGAAPQFFCLAETWERGEPNSHQCATPTLRNPACRQSAPRASFRNISDFRHRHIQLRPVRAHRA
jgi:hypothetical protein